LRAIFIPIVNPEQIRQLRSDLRCTARELAATLDIPLAEVQAWEAAERFPTKQWIDRLEKLRKNGPDAIVRKSPKASRPRPTPMEQLDNPELWLLLRKLIAHPQFYSQVAKLAAAYEDPAIGAD
jgi:hypothetical protein